MLAFLIGLIILILVLFIAGFRSEYNKELWWSNALFVLFLTIPFFIGGLHIRTGESYYTGYIYQVSTEWEKTIGHIRLSQQAGSDSQPPFCVDKADAETLEQYAGKDIKVKITEPAGFGWSYTKCTHPVTIEEVKEEL